VNSIYIRCLSNFPIDKSHGVKSGSKQAKEEDYSVPQNVKKGGHQITGSIGGCTILWNKPVFLLIITKFQQNYVTI
jgi:hypothetical protein